MRRWQIAAMWVGAVALAGLAGGCASSGTSAQRLERYRPDGDERRPLEWPGSSVAAAPAAVSTNAALLPTASNERRPSVGGVALRRGDKVVMYLRGIPQQEDLQDVVDDTGCITLPLLGNVTVEGLTTADAETRIEKAYVDGGFYRKINVAIVTEEGEYFVRGEVKQEGRYPISSDLTLLQAIAIARGYTDFARRGKIKIIRGVEDLTFDADAIEGGREPDPLIRNNDIIVVPRRLF